MTLPPFRNKRKQRSVSLAVMLASLMIMVVGLISNNAQNFAIIWLIFFILGLIYFFESIS